MSLIGTLATGVSGLLTNSRALNIIGDNISNVNTTGFKSSKAVFGDLFSTSLGGGTRVPKHDQRVASYGTVDEANAVIGLARLHTTGEADDMLARIQNDMFDLGADLCTPEDPAPKHPALRIAQAQIDRLEREIEIGRAHG